MLSNAHWVTLYNLTNHLPQTTAPYGLTTLLAIIPRPYGLISQYLDIISHLLCVLISQLSYFIQFVNTSSRTLLIGNRAVDKKIRGMEFLGKTIARTYLSLRIMLRLTSGFLLLTRFLCRVLSIALSL